ncbi:MAG TPA: hypothetical protein VHD37_02925 [Candidatus Paceibacterota bacterium]|nr:hypothetical protein [Candidatus Paceibacterota bacterium]
MRLSRFAGLFGGISLPLKPGICCIGESMEELREIANGGGFKPKSEVGDDMSGVHDQRGLPISDDRTKAQEGASVFNASSNPAGSGYFVGNPNDPPKFRSGSSDGSRRGETGRGA